jgi:hypothetical protein
MYFLSPAFATRFTPVSESSAADFAARFVKTRLLSCWIR